jgi:hydrogenase maturation protease
VSEILVAGIGNVFLGDDGFGVEVAQRLSRRQLPQSVRVEDFGIRGLDLAFALLGGIDAAILVDTVQRGERPGSLFVIEPEPEQESELDVGQLEAQALLLSAHEMDPSMVLRLVRMLGSESPYVVLVGCEAASFDPEPNELGRMGLSEPVAQAVDKAVELIEILLRQMRRRLEAES